MVISNWDEQYLLLSDIYTVKYWRLCYYPIFR